MLNCHEVHIALRFGDHSKLSNADLRAGFQPLSDYKKLAKKDP
jgi:hypothetical protein